MTCPKTGGASAPRASDLPAPCPVDASGRPASPPPPTAAEPRALTIDDLYRFAIPGDLDLSPDGTRIVYTLTTQDAEQDREIHSLWETGTDGRAPRRLTRGPSDRAPRWSPDGSAVAFLREGRIHLQPASGGEAVPLTAQGHVAGTPVWSPDGLRIAHAGADRPQSAAVPVVAERLGYKSDADGVFGEVRTHLMVVDITTGEAVQLTHGDHHVSPPAWSPDGTRLAFAASVGGRTDVTMASGAYVVDVDDPRPEPRLIGTEDGLTRTVGWFPDGQALLVVGRPTVSAGHHTLLRRPLDGTKDVPLCAELDRNVMPGGAGYPGALPQFDGDDIVFCARDRGITRLYRAGADGVTACPLPVGTGVGGCSLAPAAGRAALLVSDASRFAEIAVLDLATGELTLGSDHTGQALPNIALPPVTEREFTLADGTTVPGLLRRAADATAPGPLLVDVHGGPHNAWAPHADPVHLYHHELVARGWTVLALNIRGSDGFGEAFYTAAVGAWGEGDERDILEPVEQLVAEGLADPGRIALTGYSYGGYLTCWLSARSGRFACAVPGGLVSDLTSLAGTSDTGHDLAALEIGGDANRLIELSPLRYAAGVRAPTLILHGEDDGTCPVGQAEQWFHALRTQDVPVRMVRYPGASHLFILTGRPSYRADYSRRVLDWVLAHTPGPAAQPHQSIRPTSSGAHHD
ncbi:S9 family peptidase [Streptomyces sp. NPDC054864]